MTSRRQFISLLSGAAAAWPVTVRAQQPTMPVIGFLHSGSSNRATEFVAAFRQGMGEVNLVEGQNFAIEFRWADGNYSRLPAMAADLVSRRVEVIVTGGGFPSPLAAKAATSMIPIVFAGGSDPVAAGLVTSLNRPGGNVTGISNLSADLTAKRLGLTRALAPKSSLIAVLRNPAHPEAAEQISELQAASRSLNVELRMAEAQREADFEEAIASLAKERPGALFVANDPSYAARRYQLVALVARHALPASYSQRQFVEAGGLMSYGTNFSDLYRQAGIYTGRILRGEKPADLPVMRPTRFELVINLGTAKALKIDLPEKLLALADEVIE
jgi:putative ABC transport system substrate-binding protein